MTTFEIIIIIGLVVNVFISLWSLIHIKKYKEKGMAMHALIAWVALLVLYILDLLRS